MTKTIAFIASLFLLSASLIAGVVPASAHADLVSTDPVDGAVLEAAPESITLTFNSTILSGMAELAVTNSAQELVDGILVESAQTTATALWPASLPGDTYRVAYRIVSEDGHPITGTFSFSYPASEPTSPSEPTIAEPQVSAAPTPAEESAPVVPVSAESPSESGSVLPWVVGLIAVAVAVAATAYFVWKKRST